MLLLGKVVFAVICIDVFVGLLIRRVKMEDKVEVPQIKSLKKLRRNDDKTLNICRSAIKKWGAESQILMFHEEVGELMSAISKYHRGRVPKRKVQEEIADVEIMVTQLKVIYGLDAVNRQKEAKINRLEKRINATD